VKRDIVASSTDALPGIGRSATPHGPPSDPLTIGNIHDVLECPQRRVVLHCLQQADRPLTVDELAERATDLDVPPAVVGEYRQNQPVREWLHHEHVLELDAAGIATYDRSEDTVSLDDGISFTIQLPR
jgi:hypothetical protein